jgi:hypothetical protein
MYRNLIAAVVIALAAPVRADPVPADCARLIAPLEAIEGYAFSAPPAAAEGDWCVFDGASLRTSAADRLNFAAARLRLQGMVDADELVALSVDMSGFKVLPKAGDRKMDDRLRTLFRLQAASVTGSALVNRQVGRLELRDLLIRLQDGIDLRLEADIQGAGLDLDWLVAGSLTRLELDWRNDGRFLRPLMEMAGERVRPDVTGTEAVDAARTALGDVAGALPASIFTDESRDELDQVIAALPHGRGRLELTLQSSAGIGAARVAIAALSDDPLGPQALERIMAGSVVSVDWQPGLTP